MNTEGKNLLPGVRLVERLRVGKYFSVFRGVRESDNRAVIVKMTRPKMTGASYVRLDREYRLTRDLNDAGITRAESLETTLDGYALIFEDIGYISLQKFMQGAALSIDDFLEIAIQIVAILGRIHAHGLIHKDIRPRCILIDPESRSVKITDFGIASPLARETATHRKPRELEGSLAYIAPEQTGRMNRSVDGRSDFYALGVTFYQMLTGTLPFTSEDPSELVLQHLALVAPAPESINGNVPRSLSALVRKLMAKEPEDRYQSDSGLLHDLQSLKKQLEEHSSLEHFRIAQQDLPGKLMIPERLYGREEPLQVLMEAAKSAPGGRAQLFKVAGHSGIGKSALVREVMRPISGRQGHFISGKYDQLNRNTPYSAIVQAFEDLARKLLTGSSLRIEGWRNSLLESLGENAQVILDIIPGLTHLLGQQPPVVELGPTESQYRFNLMFRRFVRALSSSEHPLVIFLDDLQWADGASLALLEILMSDPDICNLSLICAYRDNEVHAGHPLVMLFSELESNGTPSETIELSQLDKKSIEKLVADSLHIPSSEAQSLAKLVYAKTRGNPFFTRQFLRSLNEKELLKFDIDRMQWQWDVDEINSQEITDNVVDLVAGRINRLDESSRSMVQLGACIGNVFDLQTLAVVSEMSPVEAAKALTGAMHQEIVIPIGEDYKYVDEQSPGVAEPASIRYRFPHDRLHHAAYSTIVSGQRPVVHRRVGRLILARSNDEEVEDRLFEIVNHLNLAPPGGLQEEEYLQLAQLNLRAGLRAKGSTAYAASLDYLVAGIERLGEAGRDDHSRLAFELQLNRVEATYLSGQFEDADRLANAMLAVTDNIHDEVRVRELLILSQTSQMQYRGAIQSAVDALALLDESVPGTPSKAQVILELGRTSAALLGKKPEDIVSLPAMQDPKKLAAMRILFYASAPAYFEDPNLMPYLAMRMVRISLKYGNAGTSAFGYVLYGAVLCGVLHNMPLGYTYGKLALELVDRFQANDLRGRIYQVFAGFVQLWNERIDDTLPGYLEGANACLEAGDLEAHGYNRYTHLSYSFMSGHQLDQIWELITQHYAAVLDHKHEKTQSIIRMMREAVRELRGSAAPVREENETAFDEDTEIEGWKQRDKQALAYYHKYRLVCNFMKRDYHACVESADVISENYHTVVSMLFSAYYLYLEALALSGMLHELRGAARLRALRRIRSAQRRLYRCSQHAPENFYHQYLLVSAELKRATGKFGSAEKDYEKAAQIAHRNHAMQDEAMALELLAEFYLEQGRIAIARTYLREAAEAFRRWGAYGWVEHLESRHLELLGPDSTHTGHLPRVGKLGHINQIDMIDVATITQAARAISEKIVLDDVLQAVLRAAIVNVGADHGLILLNQGEDIQVKAEAGSAQEDVILHSSPLTESNKFPSSIINYVARSLESVVIDDAVTDGTFSTDPYFTGKSVHSVICTPMIEKGMLIGFLYLENALVRGAFTPARIEVLEVLAAQSAISLENARLYREVSEYAGSLEKKVSERTQELEDAYSTLQDVFGKYVPRRVVQELVDGRGTIQPTKTTATILFADVEGFTSISERAEPEQVMRMLNEYFPAIIEPIERNGGIVHQFQGDAVLVTFNVPVPDARHADSAVRTAIEMQQVTRSRTFAGIALRTRIGINTGNVIAGNVGSGNRFNYTVHGDAVNLAARLEQLNKQYNSQVLVSGTTSDALQDTYPLELVDEVTVRGKSSPVSLYQLLTS